MPINLVDMKPENEIEFGIGFEFRMIFQRIAHEISAKSRCDLLTTERVHRNSSFRILKGLFFFSFLLFCQCGLRCWGLMDWTVNYLNEVIEMVIFLIINENS